MQDEHRPDPDQLLAAITKTEASEQRGKLKIFFGMAAGVGKTYTMLENAHRLKDDGIDVVVGYVETHGRAETEGVLRDLEIVPRRTTEYKGSAIEEMDTDAILSRRPQLVLVDELAHTNAPGSRHLKRYQDVMELLEAGIDVYTTINVQHFESRADTVHQITEIRVTETVPDSILDMANEIELIDLSPEDLQKRLLEGKVYTAERAEVAIRNFFRTGNLTALREMALRLTAEHVDHQLQDYMQLKAIAGPWKSGERLMVAVSASPFSEQLIRWTRRMAYNLEAPWFAVNVQTSNTIDARHKEGLAANLNLARSLGGEVITAQGDNVAETLIRLARQRNATQVVVGKPLQNGLLHRLRGGSLVDRLIEVSGEIDIYVVTGDKESSDERPSAMSFTHVIARSTLKQYLIASAIVVLVTLANLLIIPLVSYQAVGLTELLAVLLIAIYLGRGPALVAATVSAISWNYLFIEPRFTLEILYFEDAFLFVLYFVIAIFAGNMTAKLRTQERQSRYNAERVMALYDLAHETASAVDMDGVLTTASRKIGEVFDATVAVLLPHDDKLQRQPHICSTLPIDDKEFSVAMWVYDNGKPAGRFTETLPLATATYLPLLTSGGVVGVLGINPRHASRLDFDQGQLLETFANQLALVIQRELTDEAAEQAAMLRESERLYATLLNSISHELRTPLATISGAASSLRDPAMMANPHAREGLTHEIETASERLNRLVANLLDMSRLESGRLKPNLDWCDITDVISVAVTRFADCLEQRPLDLQIDPGLPLVRLDFVLMEQVFVNLFDNVCDYTPPGTHIRIDARFADRKLYIRMRDDGPGIPPADQERIFDKFYRVPGTVTGGTGLGLSIVRGVIEAHGGTIQLDIAAARGTCFMIELPAAETHTPVIEARQTVDG